MRRFFIRLFQAGCFGLFGYAVPRLLVASGIPLDNWINEVAAMISPDVLPWLNYESVTWGIAAFFAIAMVMVESHFGIIGRFFQEELGVLNGPTYWSLAETLSWIAFGEAITAKQWVKKIRTEGLNIRPEEETEKFNKAEQELFEKLLGKEITALGKKDHSELYEDIPAEYFLSDVECRILHDQIDVSSKNIGVMQRWRGPKWRDVRFKRENILLLWRQNRMGK